MSASKCRQRELFVHRVHHGRQRRRKGTKGVDSLELAVKKEFGRTMNFICPNPGSSQMRCEKSPNNKELTPQREPRGLLSTWAVRSQSHLRGMLVQLKAGLHPSASILPAFLGIIVTLSLIIFSQRLQYLVCPLMPVQIQSKVVPGLPKDL